MNNNPLFPDPKKTSESLFKKPTTEETPVKTGFILRILTNQPTLKDRYIFVWYSAIGLVISLISIAMGILVHHWEAVLLNSGMAGLNFWAYRVNDRQYEEVKKKLSLDK